MEIRELNSNSEQFLLILLTSIWLDSNNGKSGIAQLAVKDIVNM